MRYRHIGNNGEIPPLTRKIFNWLKDRMPDKGKPIVSWAYKKLSSITTSIYILCTLVLFYIVGTIFPQGGELEEYINAGGKFVFFVKLFDLLDLFSSPLFLIAAFILFLNLLICGYERLVFLSSGARAQKSFTPEYELVLPYSLSDAHQNVKELFTDKLRFKQTSKDGEWTVLEKGLSYRWLTWLYHLGILICFFGFALTWLFAFEDSVVLKPNVLTTVISKETGRLQKKLWKAEEGTTDIHLLLTDVMVEYIEAPELKYPKDKASRLAIGLGWKAPEYEMKADSLTVKDWRPKVKVVKGNLIKTEKLMEVNEPLEYGGYTFYLMDYRQKFKVRVDDNPIPLETSAEEDLFIPGFPEPLVIGTHKKGLVTRIDGTVETLSPGSMIQYRRKAADGEKKVTELGRATIGGSIEVNGRLITIADMEEELELSYRYDPGVSLLWLGGLLALVMMSLRFYGRWYMLAYTIDETTATPTLQLAISSRGLGANKERLLRRVTQLLASSKEP